MDTLAPANDQLLSVRTTTKRGPAGTLRGYTSASALTPPHEAVHIEHDDGSQPEWDRARRNVAAALGSDEFVRGHHHIASSGLRRKSDDGTGTRELGATGFREEDTDSELGRLRREGGKRRQLAPAASEVAGRSSSTPSSSSPAASSRRLTPESAHRRSSPIRVRSPVGGGNAPVHRARTPSGSGTKSGSGSTAISKLAVNPKGSWQALTPLDVGLHQQPHHRRVSATSTLEGVAVTRCRSVPRRSTAPAALLRAPSSAAMSPSPSTSSARSSGGSSGSTLTHGDASSLRPHNGSCTPPLLSSAAMAITSSTSSTTSSSGMSTHTMTNSPVGPCPNPRGSTLSLLGQDLVLPPCVTPTEVVAYGGEAGGKALEAQVCQPQQQQQQQEMLQMAMADAYVRDDGVYCPVPTLPAQTGSGHSSHATTSAASSRRTSLSGEPKKRRSLSVATTASSMSMSSISAINGVGGGANALGAQLTMTSANPNSLPLLTAAQLCAAESLPSPLASPGSRTSLGSLPGAPSATSKQAQMQSHRGGEKRNDAAVVDLESLPADSTAPSEDQHGAGASDGDADTDADGDGSTIKRTPPTRPPLPSYTSFEDVGIPRPPSPPPSPPATGAASGPSDGMAVTSKSWWQL